MDLAKRIFGGLLAFAVGSVGMGGLNVLPERKYSIDKSNISVNCDKRAKKVDLSCDCVAKIDTNDFSFYACEEDVNSDLVSKMQYIADVKKYGKEKLGMRQTTNYRVYKNRKTDMPITSYMLFVTSPFLIPQRWENWHEITRDGKHEINAGTHILLYSLEDSLTDEEVYYKIRGYDTYWRSFTSFGGGCDLDVDFLKVPILEQTEKVLHEDWHVTVHSRGQDQHLEESIAALVGKAGAIDFIRGYFPHAPMEHRVAESQLEVWRVFSLNVIQYNSLLQNLYARNDLSPEQKLAEKKRIFGAPNPDKVAKNNALLWGSLPYTMNFPLVYEVYKKHSNMSELAKILINAPSEEKDAIEYLKKFTH